MPINLYCLDYDRARWVCAATVTAADIVPHIEYAERELVDDLARYDLPGGADDLLADYRRPTPERPVVARRSDRDAQPVPVNLDTPFDPRPSWATR